MVSWARPIRLWRSSLTLYLLLNFLAPRLAHADVQSALSWLDFSSQETDSLGRYIWYPSFCPVDSISFYRTWYSHTLYGPTIHSFLLCTCRCPEKFYTSRRYMLKQTFVVDPQKLYYNIWHIKAFVSWALPLHVIKWNTTQASIGFCQCFRVYHSLQGLVSCQLFICNATIAK